MRVSPETEAKLLAMPGVTINGVMVAGVGTPSPVAGRMSEEVFHAAVCDLATRNSWRWYHPTISRRSKEGYPDLTCVRGNVVLFAELKSEEGVREAEQCNWADCLEAVGGNVLYRCWRPSDWGDVMKVLTGRVES